MTETPSALAYLATTSWADWQPDAIAGDASARRYWRLTSATAETAILLDNGAPHGAGIDRFVDLAQRLIRAGLAAPAIWRLSPDSRFAILEDLGPTTLAAHLAATPEDETALYAAAGQLIARIQSTDPPGDLVTLTPAIAAAMLDPLGDRPEDAAPPGTLAAARAAIEAGLSDHCPGPMRLSLRDFHAENLILRPGNDGADRFGLIDFQDAFLAPPEYDLASFLRDARRDVSDDACAAAITAFCAATGRGVEAATRAMSMLAIQRNLRILGIFDRLIRVERKPRYARFVPRVIGHIRRDLTHPALEPLTPAIAPILTSFAE